MPHGYILLPPEGHRATARQLCKLAGYNQVSYDAVAPCKISKDHVVVNWGNGIFSRPLSPKPQYILNAPEVLRNSINKLNTFQMLTENNIPCPEWTTNDMEAREWYDKGHVVYTRTRLTGSSGEGINLQIPNVQPWREYANAKVHTKRFNGKEEFRVHVFNGKVIHVQQKKLRRGWESPDDAHPKYIKNMDSGYVFAIQDVACPDNILEACVAAVKLSGMDFGAVDVGYKPTKDEYCIFEINSRPALNGTTLIKYSEALKELIK